MTITVFFLWHSQPPMFVCMLLTQSPSLLIFRESFFRVFSANGKEPTCQYRRHQRLRFDPRVGNITWSGKWQPAPVLLPGKSHGQRSLVDYRQWSCKGLDMTKHTHRHPSWTFRESSGSRFDGLTKDIDLSIEMWMGGYPNANNREASRTWVWLWGFSWTIIPFVVGLERRDQWTPSP